MSGAHEEIAHGATPTVTVVVINYRAMDCLEDLARTVREWTRTVSYEMIVLDNASGTEERERLKDWAAGAGVQLVCSDANLGFAAGVNRAATRARGRFLLLLNPDARFVEDSLDRVVARRMRSDRPVIIGVRLVDEDGAVQIARQVFPNVRDTALQAFFVGTVFPKRRWSDRVYYGWLEGDKEAVVDAVRGAFLFVDRPVFDQLGGLDEDYFLYTEEVDFCFRARAAGVETIYFPATTVIHHGARSSRIDRAANFVELYRSKLIFVRKHRGVAQERLMRVVLFLAAANRVLLNMVLFAVARMPSERSSRAAKARVYAYACRWFIRGMPKRDGLQRP